MIDIIKDNVLFSIIVPAFNSEAFIGKCIDSVLEQTYNNFELILVDDGSVDNTLSVCNSYKEKDCRIKVVHKENGGHTSARNAGLETSIGDYVVFLDSDDWLSDCTLEACRDKIISDNPDIIVFRLQASDNDTPFSVLLPDGCYSTKEILNSNCDNFIIGRDGSCLFPKSLSAKCFKREIIYKSQLNIPTEIRIAEDGAAFIGAVLNSKVITVMSNDLRACYYCLVRLDSVSRSVDADAFSKAILLLLFYEKILNASQTDRPEQLARYVVAQLYTALLLTIRSGETSERIDAEFNKALKYPIVLYSLKKAKFNLKGYRYLIKKTILKHRWWKLAETLDKGHL